MPKAVRPNDELDLDMIVLEKRESKSNPTEESFASESSCATKGEKQCWNVSSLF